jgi:hypothetical protein
VWFSIQIQITWSTPGIAGLDAPHGLGGPEERVLVDGTLVVVLVAVRWRRASPPVPAQPTTSTMRVSTA